MPTHPTDDNFFRFLWTGKFGLWPTFWVFGVIGAPVVFVGLLTGYTELADLGERAVGMALVKWLIYSCLVAICIWRAAGPASLYQPRSLLRKLACLAPFASLPILIAVSVSLGLGGQPERNTAVKFDSSTAVEVRPATPAPPAQTQAQPTHPAPAHAASVPAPSTRAPVPQYTAETAASQPQAPSKPPCIFKSVMSNADYAACGLNPPVGR